MRQPWTPCPTATLLAWPGFVASHWQDAMFSWSKGVMGQSYWLQNLILSFMPKKIQNNITYNKITTCVGPPVSQFWAICTYLFEMATLDSAHPTFTVQQWSTAVAGVDRGICLNDAFTGGIWNQGSNISKKTIKRPSVAAGVPKNVRNGTLWHVDSSVTFPMFRAAASLQTMYSSRICATIHQSSRALKSTRSAVPNYAWNWRRPINTDYEPWSALQACCRRQK